MNDVITQQLISLLQPLLPVTLTLKGDVVPEGNFADLAIVAISAIGMGNEVSQGVDDQGNLLILTSYQAEIAIRYFGADSLMQLSALVSQLQRISVSEQFQRANIGIGRLDEVVAITTEGGELQPMGDAEFRFFIHYTVAINDTVGVIEHIHAAHDGGKINIHLTR